MADVSPTTTSRRVRPPDTSSRCEAETVTATHDFEVSNFSQLNGHIGAGRSLKSAPFNVGGFNWAIEFYPDGSDATLRCCYCIRMASAFVTICDGAVGARARFTLSLVDRHGRASRWWRRSSPPRTFGWPYPTTRGFNHFYLKPFLRFFSDDGDDRLKIRCEITVLSPPRTENTTPAAAPQPELMRHLRSLLADGPGADVTFAVAGREFRAHRVMLAARSPVFRAALYGAMAENDPRRVIEIVDVDPAIFEMLLDFVYTDALPGGVDCAATMQHLLVAADRYGLDRLKLMCAERLHRSIDVTTVTATLALADQHHCQLLKEACIAFLSSPKVLRLVVATDEFKQLMATCPLVLSGSLDTASSEKK